MSDVSIRDLRNHGGDVIARVIAGETLTVTRSGRPVAELSPVRRTATSTGALLEHWRRLPPVDPTRLRADIDDTIDQSL